MRDGYKQTEIGELPDEWTVSSLGELIQSTQLGGNYPNSDAETAYPLMKMGNMDRGAFNTRKIEFVARGQTPLERDRLEQGDVLFNTRNTLDLVGKVAIWNDELPGSYFNSNIMRLKFRQDAVSSNAYMNFALNSRRSVQTLRELATGTTSVAAIYSRDLFQLLLTVPTKEEQIAIAEVLSDVDGLIAGLEALIAKKRDLKTATMQQLLTGKTRLPGFGGAWNRTKIGSHIDLLTGFPFPSAKYSDDGVRLLRGSNIKREVLDWNPRLVQFWPTVSAELQKYLLAEGDIVIAMDGSLVGRSFAVMSKPDLPALLLQRVARIRSKDIEQKYLRHWVCSQFFTSHCDEVKTVTAIPHISPEDIRSFEIHLPPTKDEQLEIANVIDDLIAEGALLADKLQKAKALKQGMMQELLTGRTRLI